MLSFSTIMCVLPNPIRTLLPLRSWDDYGTRNYTDVLVSAPSQIFGDIRIERGSEIISGLGVVIIYAQALKLVNYLLIYASCTLFMLLSIIFALD